MKLLAIALGLWIGGVAAQAQVQDLDGRRVDPLQVLPGVKAVVLDWPVGQLLRRGAPSEVGLRA